MKPNQTKTLFLTDPWDLTKLYYMTTYF